MSTFSLFEYLRLFYNEHKRVIRQDYKDLTKKILSHANPANANCYLRTPQYEAFEMYVFLKEYLNNPKLGDLFENWCNNKGRFRRDDTLRQHMCKVTHSNGKMSYRLCRSSALWCRLTCGALLNNSLTVCEHSPNDESFTSAVGRCPFPLAIYDLSLSWVASDEYRLYSLARHVRVNLRRRYVGMPEHLLHRQQICAMRYQMRRKRMP